MLSCSYCILRGYLNAPRIAIHDDVSYIIAQVEEVIDFNEHARGNLSSEYGEREGEALTAAPVEGAT